MENMNVPKIVRTPRERLLSAIDEYTAAKVESNKWRTPRIDAAKIAVIVAIDEVEKEAIKIAILESSRKSTKTKDD